MPRHLRDMIVTQYGIADIRGKSDRDVIAAMLAITDECFQDELLRQAKDAGKIERSFELAKAAHDNTPDAIERALKPAADAGLLPMFPFSTDFTEVEQLQSASTKQLATLLMRAYSASADKTCFDRLGLAKPGNFSEWLYAALVRGAIESPVMTIMHS